MVFSNGYRVFQWIVVFGGFSINEIIFVKILKDIGYVIGLIGMYIFKRIKYIIFIWRVYLIKMSENEMVVM